ncbi:cysteine--tRNA ligase [Streptobacillus moniliformis]|uniref:Cysteine--tRNA ligase n=1 Tax=Streptobacillus moniliformis (strain ATCC 14647 / DSM 12112 / NCTC 10651 / 9901) TaxID=519441 RepID=D1AXT7_STRM9|nr:cysteine--tRNA ligase [Streptobacillus moniliformis]ACZ01113.1 cysteinyl-tRNA synthetase [Streptobacillus moniliformis DSM 12112]AVL42521.1 cysteine--tRNA ligase [Streptobacillus moniliformis]SQA13745.1 Cysteine--tRNA ligase [Streptobacillus moniliformis]
MKIYNSLNNKLEEFIPINDKKVGIYVCGPTVYNYIHFGNSRPVIVFDTLARHFINQGYEVSFVQNFTDIDDKIINKSIEENIPFEEISKKYINAFMEDISKLNILDIVKRPKVSEYIPDIIEMIEVLIYNGYAYERDGDVLFRVNKYLEYGKLSNQKLSDLSVGVRINKDEKKENPLDFVLWKKKKENEPYWNAPFSEGRPGWHIECSAMSRKLLGDNFDIHAGGIDLLFPHHENERAQSVCFCNEKSSFANYWMHNGFLEVNGEKMSKSLGNFITLREILNDYSGDVVRFFMLSTHYRKPINYSIENLEISKKTLNSIIDTIDRYKQIDVTNNSNNEIKKDIIEFELAINSALNDDLNTPLAISCIHDLIKKTNKYLNSSIFREITLVVEILEKYIINVLGIKMEKNKNDMLSESLIELLNKIREDARMNKNYALSDMIRDELLKLGIKTVDGKVK